MKKLIIFIAIISIAFGLSCTNPSDGGDAGDPGAPPEVYITGHSYDGIEFYSTYWHFTPDTGDVETTYLNDVSDTPGYGKSIYADTDNVYVVGHYFYETESNYIGAYWKYNGADITQVPLNDGTTSYKAFDLQPNGDDMYIIGREKDIWDYEAVYWKVDASDNVEQYSLTDGTVTTAEGHSIFVDGSTIYGAGYDRASAEKKAVYWKVTGGAGGTVTQVDLTDGTTDAEAYSIWVDSGNVYVAGYYTNASDVEVAAYWIDEGADGSGITKIDLSSGVADKEGVAGDIMVYGSDVYIYGGYNGSSGSVATSYTMGALWKNSVTGDGSSVETTDLSPNMRVAEGRAISILNDVIYLAGTYIGTMETAAVWVIDGTDITKTDLTSPPNDGFANGIFVEVNE